MFTAKVVEQDGTERGKEIRTWIYFPEGAPLNETQSKSGIVPRVSVYVPDGDYWEDYTEGTVYIMNSRGSTVASYVMPTRMTEVATV